MSASEIIRNYALAQVGSPYVYGGTARPCTPQYRQARQKQYPKYAATIAKQCRVLSGKQKLCNGCKYHGKKVFDCAQLTRYAAKEAGLTLPSGSTTQWKTVKWLQTGTIDTLPDGWVAFLYKVNKDGTVPHTGIAIGDGTAVDARGHSYGVIRRMLKQYGWTHWAILPGMGISEIPKEDKGMELRNGSKGAQVKKVQEALIKLQHDLGKWGADGSFGSATERAVKEFQEASGLPVTGVWTQAEQDKLMAYEAAAKEQEQEQVQEPVPVPTGTVTISLPQDTAKAIFAALGAVLQ